jgi:hypothetical protein
MPKRTLSEIDAADFMSGIMTGVEFLELNMPEIEARSLKLSNDFKAQKPSRFLIESAKAERELSKTLLDILSETASLIQLVYNV